MTLTYNDEQRREYLNLTERLGRDWLSVFEGDQEFYSAAYWDLLTGLWHAGGAVRKTDALGMMKAVKSAHTGGKYLAGAIVRGLVVESDNPEDARSKLVRLSPEMSRRLDRFFDGAVAELRRSAENIATKGPVPKKP